MKLGYARISTSDQDASMQIEEFISVGWIRDGFSPMSSPERRKRKSDPAWRS